MLAYEFDQATRAPIIPVDPKVHTVLRLIKFNFVFTYDTAQCSENSALRSLRLKNISPGSPNPRNI